MPAMDNFNCNDSSSWGQRGKKGVNSLEVNTLQIRICPPFGYQDTFNSGCLDTKQAWQLTFKFVKRIFIKLGDNCITTRAGIHIDDPWTSAAKFLFATLLAHEVMHSFMCLDIKNHPSISSKMVNFICYSQPAIDTTEVLGCLNSVESMQRMHQSNISKLDLKSKKLDTWKAEIEKLLKKLKDKAEIA
jgi:hypothetical protein